MCGLLTSSCDTVPLILWYGTLGDPYKTVRAFCPAATIHRSRATNKPLNVRLVAANVVIVVVVVVVVSTLWANKCAHKMLTGSLRMWHATRAACMIWYEYAASDIVHEHHGSTNVMRAPMMLMMGAVKAVTNIPTGQPGRVTIVAWFMKNIMSAILCVIFGSGCGGVGCATTDGQVIKTNRSSSGWL